MTSVALQERTTDVKTLLYRELATLAPRTRSELIGLIVEASADELRRPDSHSLARNLHSVREVLREPLPARVKSKQERQAVHTERLLAIDETSFWIRGWATDSAGDHVTLTAISPEGIVVDLLEGSHRHLRRDVDQFFAGAGSNSTDAQLGAKHGLIRYFELDAPSRLPEGWVVQLRDASGGGVEEEAPPATSDFVGVRNAILTDVADFGGQPVNDELMSSQVQPALSRLQHHLNDAATADSVTQYGMPSRSPETSIIVLLFGRIDFMEHQLAQFFHDPAFGELDLIYVLDSPHLRAELEASAAQLHELYRVPFRTVVLNRNAGFAIANNVAASLARGRVLLLLNSDVLPSRTGWVETMKAFYDATPKIAALGPKLLYEDGSLQHAGLYFARDPAASLWGNQHYYKGLHSDFPAANVARPVPAVTGACLMIDRALYEESGGLSPEYVQGGYEDSDLCLRLSEAGHTNWYLPHAVLYHLEDQSYPSAIRKIATTYNAWLQSDLWGTRIEEIMSRDSFVDTAAEASDSQVTEHDRHGDRDGSVH